MTTEEIPDDIALALRAAVYERRNLSAVREVLERLGIQSGLVRQFFETYRGPFWSQTLFYELLDPCEGDQTISKITEICRNKFSFPPTLIVLTELSAGEQVVVLDREKETLYVVDFEGGVTRLIRGDLAPRWSNFREFLQEYFEGYE